MRCESRSGLSGTSAVQRGEQGFSLLQVVIAIAIIGIVTSLGIMGFTRAQKDMQLSGAMRQFAGYLEKGRVEAVRRNSTLAIMTINSASSYTVALDSNYDGTTSASESRTVTLPTGMTFNSTNITYPATISFNSRGRSSTTNITGSTLTMSNTYGYTTSLTMTGGGDVTLDSTVTGPAANTNLNPTTTVSNTSSVRSLY